MHYKLEKRLKDVKLSPTTKYQRDKLRHVHSLTSERNCRDGDDSIALNKVVYCNVNKVPDVDDSEIIVGDEGLDFWNICVPEGAPAQLRCEECGNVFAVVACDECCEVLCASCTEQIHLTSQGNNYHPHIQCLAVRRLRSGDTSRIHHDPSDEAQYEGADTYLGEEELAQMRDLSQSSALEAPGITTLAQQMNSAIPRNRMNSSFSHGDIVIIPVSCLDAVPRYPDEAYLQESKPKWCHDIMEEVYAEIQDTTEERHCIQDCSDCILRVRVLACVVRNYIEGSVLKRLMKERGICLAQGATVDDAAAAAADMRGNSNNNCSDLATPQLLKTITGNDEKMAKQLKTGMEYSDGYGPYYHELHNAVHILESGGFISSVRASHVESLSAKIMWQKERKENALNDMIALLTRVVIHKKQRNALLQWNNTTAKFRTREHNRAAVIIQACMRGYSSRKTYYAALHRIAQALERSRVQLHSQFHFVTPKPRTTIFTTGSNKAACFATRSELNKFETFSRKLATRVWNKLVSRSQGLVAISFKRWILKTRELAILDKSLARFDPTMDPPRSLGKKGKPEIEEDIKLLLAGLHTLKLPPLPDTYSQMKSNGILKVNCWPKFNSMLTAHAGPTPWCSWIILGKLILSGYPGPGSHHLSTAIQRNRGNVMGHYLESTFSSGVGVFIGLHSEEECQKHEELNNLPPIKDSMLDALKDVENRILTEREEALLSLEFLLNQQRDVNVSSGNDDGVIVKPRCQTELEFFREIKTAKQRLSKAYETLKRIPKSLEFIWECEPPSFSSSQLETNQPRENKDSLFLLRVARKTEKWLQEGKAVCIWSTDGGRGWAAAICTVLLSRLYGIDTCEALHRVQLCYNSHYYLTHRSREMQGATCIPQTIAQHNAVKDACLHVDSIFGDIIIHESRPTSSNSGVANIRQFSRNSSNKPHLLKATNIESNDQYLQGMAIQDTSANQSSSKRNR